MKEEKHLPSRETLDQSFHQLQDQITRISVQEEAEMIESENAHDDSEAFQTGQDTNNGETKQILENPEVQQAKKDSANSGRFQSDQASDKN